jgi:hypothetical protein
MLLAAPAARPAAVQREIAVRAPAKVAVRLDADIYDRARSDLGDLRVVDDLGGHTPYLLERMDDGPSAPLREPAAINRGFVRGASATATLDFGAPTLKTELALSLTGDNFRRRVTVEGRQRQDPTWTTLTDDAYVFAIPGVPPVRYETVSLPENDFELVRVTVFRGADDPPLLQIRGAWIRPAQSRGPHEAPLPQARVSRAEDGRARETVLTVELGARHQPFRAVVLDVADARFFREAAVEARRSALPTDTGDSSHPHWVPVASGAVYRYEEGGRVQERLRVEACGREQAFRVRIRNRDDRPLDIRGVRVLGPVERLVFEARPQRRYLLEYGVPDRSSPSYDVARTARHPHLWAADAVEATFGRSAPRRAGAARLAWTERHPALLWVGLVTIVAALGGLTWRALRAAG